MTPAGRYFDDAGTGGTQVDGPVPVTINSADATTAIAFTGVSRPYARMAEIA